VSEEERGAIDDVGLLRALAEQAMQENGLADAQGAASVSVVPSTATVAAAGMDIGTPRYEAAIGRLLEAGALERDRPHANVQGEPEAFRINERRHRPAAKDRIAGLQYGCRTRGPATNPGPTFYLRKGG
jgi:hypothetical protein